MVGTAPGAAKMVHGFRRKRGGSYPSSASRITTTWHIGPTTHSSRTLLVTALPTFRSFRSGGSLHCSRIHCPKWLRASMLHRRRLHLRGSSSAHPTS